MSLLNKLREKLASVKAPKKLIAGLAMAGVLSLSGCNINTPSNNVDPNNPDTTITNPSDGDTTDPTDPNTTDPNTSTDPNTTDTDTTEQHSQILKDVINSSYYVNVIYSNTVDNDTSYYSKNQEILPIPYGFLANNGYNIESIKNNELSCTSNPYMLEDEPNSLYIACKAETKASLDYYTCYTLKYTLSDLELSDLKYLCDNRAAEGPLFIQELSYQKTPSVLTKASMSVTAYNSILEACTKQNNSWATEELFGSLNVTIDVLGFSTNENSLELAVRTNPLNPKQSGILRYAHLTSGDPTYDVTSVYINNTEVYIKPYPYVTYYSTEARNEYKSEYTPITLYGYEISYVHRIFEDFYTKNL